MAKILTGKVVSNGMTNTIVVEVVRRTPHPLYRKLLKRSKTYKVETNGVNVPLGERVRIVETKPLSKDKHFMLLTEKNLTEEKSTVVKTKEGKKA
jgi:small subunit ribosomal protein S17